MLLTITRTDANDSDTPSLYETTNEFPGLAHVDGAQISAREGDYVRQAADYLEATPNAMGANFPGLRIDRTPEAVTGYETDEDGETWVVAKLVF